LLIYYIKRILKRLPPKNDEPFNEKTELPVSKDEEPGLIKEKDVDGQDLAMLAELQNHLELAEDHRTFGFYEKAKEELLLALATDPQNIEVLIALGDLCLEMVGTNGGEKTLDEAVEIYQQALDIQPERGLIYYKLGVALDRRGRFREALESFEKAKEFGFEKEQLSLDIKRIQRILKFNE